MDATAPRHARAEFRSRSKRRPSNRGVVFPHVHVIARLLRRIVNPSVTRAASSLKGLETASTRRAVALAVATALMGMRHVNRVEAPRQTVYPAFLAANQCVHDLHAGELGQYHERCPLDYCISYRSAYWAPGCTFDFHACSETLRASIRQCAGRWCPDNVGRRLLAHESLPYPLCRARRDGCNFRSLDAGGLIPLRRPRATPSGGMGSGFRTADPLTFRTHRAKRKGLPGVATFHDRVAAHGQREFATVTCPGINQRRAGSLDARHPASCRGWRAATAAQERSWP
ncbi:hypothetical protein LMG29660_02713 [Burkholderia puraquae]|uniref:Uncharacterized protein n=1 Tax=Burkholderia puraquae TaxID=1904757 RepID=A0A6J5DSL2_9BURK|nr:hypothetical protein LMG29660_02713 [Burkholderia puraquae]